MKKTNMQQILEFLMPKLAERMDKIYPTDKEYKKSVNKEEKLYDTLRKELSKEHLQIFDEYVHTTIDTTNAVGRIAYIQGMKDMLAFLKALS